MGIFQRSKPTANTPLPAGRRRPLEAESRAGSPGTMFSYHSQRSAADANLGRREPIDTISTDRGGPAASLSALMAGISLSGRRRTVVLCLAVLGLIVLGYFSILSPDPRIILLQDDTTAYFLQDSETYRRTAGEALQTSVFNRSKLAVDTAALQTGLLTQHPEIRNVSVKLPIFGNQPQVYIEPYKPSFILTTSSGGAYLLDATGRALASTSQISNIESLGVATVQDATGTAIEIGKPALPGSTVEFIQSVVSALKAKSINAQDLSLVTAYELDVRIAGQPYYVKFNLQNDALQQAGTYLAVQNRLNNDKVIPGQYIDVRVPDRAYYR